MILERYCYCYYHNYYRCKLFQMFDLLVCVGWPRWGHPLDTFALRHQRRAVFGDSESPTKVPTSILAPYPYRYTRHQRDHRRPPGRKNQLLTLSRNGAAALPATRSLSSPRPCRYCRCVARERGTTLPSFADRG